MRLYKLLLITFLLVPLFALAVNDVSISADTNFQLNTSDTAVLTTVVASAGGQVTNFDVQSNYIDITIDNLSSVTFTTTVGGQFLKITKQSGSNDYTVSPACPTTTATLTGTGATVVLRLQVQTTNNCVTPPPSGGGGGGALPQCSITSVSNGSVSTYPSCAITCNTGFTLVNNSCTPTTSSTTPPATTADTACPQGDIYNITTGKLCTSWTTAPPATTPTAPASAQTCSPYITKYMKLGGANDPAEVAKLQNFLRDYEGEKLLMATGIYNQATFNAVKRFQTKYANDVLIPWGLTTPTGYVYRTTIFKINALYCAKAKGCFPYLTKYIKLGAANDLAEVTKLQNFLRVYEGFVNISTTGIYNQATYTAVKVFQARYASDILTPWHIYNPTGYVFRTTIFKINELYCAKFQ